MAPRKSTPATTWVALLRAVNLGARNRVPMPDLRRALEAEGYDDVRTYIASGNVVFRTDEGGRDAQARRLEDVVRDEFGVDTTVVLRSPAELAALLDAGPVAPDASTSHVTFLAAKPSPAARDRLRALDVAPDRFELRGADVLLHYPNGVQGSRLTTALLERELGVRGTNRTWKTVTKLAELAGTA